MGSMIPHLFLFLLLPLVVVFAQNNQITIGSSLTAGDASASASPWSSPSDDFAFGFRDIGNDLFLLSIWYNKLPEKTIVWYPRNGNNPAPRGSIIILNASDGLMLQSPQGASLWTPGIVSVTPVAFGKMDDTGNFVLLNSNSESLWESFQNPSDTLLPNQTIEISNSLISHKSKNDYSQGRFQFTLFERLVVLNIINSHAESYGYFDSRQVDGYRIVFDNNGSLYVMQRNRSRINVIGPEVAFPVETHYYKVTLNFDGVLTLSHRPKNPNGTWSDSVIMPDNICTAIRGELGSGTCGYNSICTLQNDRRPSCACPRGYSLIDPNDTYGDCKPDIPQVCEEGGENSANNPYILQELRNTDWPMLDYEHFRSISREECQKVCLLDCLCVVSVYRDGHCWKKKLPLANGRTDSTEISVSYLKLRNTSSTGQNPDLPEPRGKKNPDILVPREKKNQDTLIIVISVLLGSSTFVILILVTLLCLGSIFDRKRTHSPRETYESNLRSFTYKELSEATNGFKDEAGRGSCGIVYKGMMEISPVAVKILDRKLEESEKEFRIEVNVIAQTHHKNLVRLLGYCDEGNNRILVYEFMSNGTLAGFLFGDMKPSWKLRTQIACGIARGLFYLHEECSTQIIHCDIKPQNVLLDEYYNVKISDFGLAKLLKMDQSRTETGIRGTKGYVAPDWFRSAPVTAKVDVYSFGVLLLEIICCRRNGDIEDVGGERGLLIDWADDCFHGGRLNVLVEGDVEAIDDMKKLERFVMVAIWCLQEDPSQRPTMKRAMLMLEGIVHVSVPPSPCPFTSTS